MNTIQKFKKTFQQLPQFSQLTEETQKLIAVSAIHRRFETGQVIYLEGEKAEYIYILESGWVKATRMTRSGREQAMMFLRPVEVFGDIASLTGKSYPGTVTALETVTVWAIPATTVLDLIHNQPSFALSVIQHLGERVLHYINLVEDLSLRSVEARLANTLLAQAEQYGNQMVVPRRDWATYDQMAVRLGTVRDVLSRALKTLEIEGLIEVERQSIRIIDPKKLAERADR